MSCGSQTLKLMNYLVLCHLIHIAGYKDYNYILKILKQTFLEPVDNNGFIVSKTQLSELPTQHQGFFLCSTISVMHSLTKKYS